MYNLDMNKVKEIVAEIVKNKTVENVAFVGCCAS